MNYLKKDNLSIYHEQKATFQFIYDHVDLSKITFVGGVADYINLRDYYKMPVHDLDIIFQDEEDLKEIIKKIGVKKYTSSFYKIDQMEVLVAKFFINNKSVHIDFFKLNNIREGISKSYLLGKQVQHSSFKSMQTFHNTYVGKLTSDVLGEKYEWKRLYKHSKKASLYNMITYQKEKLVKELIHA
ncbi:MAG: hypothetical protein KUG68_07865 [Flavobacteriaceae bacterium]|nr:hypothetical protein [Flavobacteriaceae bacterium]